MRAAAFVLVAFLLCPASAGAQGRRLKPPPRQAVNLTFEVAPGLGCPGEKGLRLAVRSELGYDPFVDDPAPLRRGAVTLAVRAGGVSPEAGRGRVGGVVTGQLDVREAAARLPAEEPDQPDSPLDDDPDAGEDPDDPDGADA